MSTPQKSRLKVLAAAGTVVILGGLAWWAYEGKPWQTLGNHQIAAGQPLAQSNSQIEVLNSAEETPQTLTASSELLSSQARISLTTQASPPPPAVFDKTAAQLGTTISLLVSSWPNGGPMPRKLADAAAQLAEATQQPALADAAQTLRNTTPREGPVTLALLLVETAHVLTLAPPSNLPETAAAAEAQKSWLRKQLEQLISIRSTPATQNSWSTALATAQQQIARGMVTDAMQTLTASPLNEDNRLSSLRSSVRGYLDQSGKLHKLVTTYSNTFLKAEK